MKRILFPVVAILMGHAAIAMAQDAQFQTVDAKVAAEKGCLSCHEGIERFTDGAMIEQTSGVGRQELHRKMDALQIPSGDGKIPGYCGTAAQNDGVNGRCCRRIRCITACRGNSRRRAGAS